MIKQKVGEVVTEVIKATPPVATVGLTFLGFPLADWVQLAVLLYTLLQMHVLAKNNLGFYKSLLSWLKEVGHGKGQQG